MLVETTGPVVVGGGGNGSGRIHGNIRKGGNFNMCRTLATAAATALARAGGRLAALIREVVWLAPSACLLTNKTISF